MEQTLSGYVSSALTAQHTVNTGLADAKAFCLDLLRHFPNSLDIQEVGRQLQDRRNRVTVAVEQLQTSVLCLKYCGMPLQELSHEYCVPDTLYQLLQNGSPELAILETYQKRLEDLRNYEQYIHFVFRFPAQHWFSDDWKVVIEPFLWALRRESISELPLPVNWIDVYYLTNKLQRLRCFAAELVSANLLLFQSVQNVVAQMIFYCFNNRCALPPFVPEDEVEEPDWVKPLKELLEPVDLRSVDLITSWESAPEYWNNVAFKETCGRSGFTNLYLIPITGDGNCFFRSIVRFLWPHCPEELEMDYCLTLRRLLNPTTEREEKNSLHEFEEEGVTDTQTMMKPGVWADHLQVLKLSAFLNRPVWLYRPDDPGLALDDKTRITPGAAYQIQPDSEEIREQLRENLLMSDSQTHYEVLVEQAAFLVDLSTRVRYLEECVENFYAYFTNGSLLMIADCLLNAIFCLCSQAKTLKEDVSSCTNGQERLDKLKNVMKTICVLKDRFPDDFWNGLVCAEHGKLHAYAVSDLFEYTGALDSPPPANVLNPIASVLRLFREIEDLLRTNKLQESESDLENSIPAEDPKKRKNSDLGNEEEEGPPPKRPRAAWTNIDPNKQPDFELNSYFVNEPANTYNTDHYNNNGHNNTYNSQAVDSQASPYVCPIPTKYINPEMKFPDELMPKENSNAISDTTALTNVSTGTQRSFSYNYEKGPTPDFLEAAKQAYDLEREKEEKEVHSILTRDGKSPSSSDNEGQETNYSGLHSQWSWPRQPAVSAHHRQPTTSLNHTEWKTPVHSEKTKRGDSDIEDGALFNVRAALQRAISSATSNTAITTGHTNTNTSTNTIPNISAQTEFLASYQQLSYQSQLGPASLLDFAGVNYVKSEVSLLTSTVEEKNVENAEKEKK